MPCGVLDALYAFVYPWLARAESYLMALDGLVRLAFQRTMRAASLLFSFEALIIASLLTFLVLGGALSMLLIWPIVTESDDDDEYDDCEKGLYYADGGGRWVAVPVIVVGRSAQTSNSEQRTPRTIASEKRRH